MFRLEVQEGADVHVPYRRQVVEEGDGDEHEDLVAAVSPKHLERLIEMHDDGGDARITASQRPAARTAVEVFAQLSTSDQRRI